MQELKAFITKNIEMDDAYASEKSGELTQLQGARKAYQNVLNFLSEAEGGQGQRNTDQPSPALPIEASSSGKQTKPKRRVGLKVVAANKLDAK